MNNKGNNGIVYGIVGLIVGSIITTGFYSLNQKKEVHDDDHGAHVMSDGTVMKNDDVSMASMMHDMNKALEGKTGTEFDQAFLAEMIVHHQGAVDMAQKVLEVSKKPELIKLANDIITAQNKEIEMMKKWQGEWK